MEQDKGLKMTLKQWIKKVGSGHATATMIEQGLSPSTADKVANGRYESSFRESSLDAIRRAMMADGYLLNEQQAS